jgi:hypothetical protein
VISRIEIGRAILPSRSSEYAAYRLKILINTICETLH